MANADVFDAGAAGAGAGLLQAFRRFSVIFFPSFILILIVACYLIYNQLGVANESLRKDETVTVARGSGVVGASLRDAVGDARYLAGHVQETLETNHHPDAQQTLLSESFKLFAETQRIYDQVRFIGKDGQEIARVNYDGNKAEIVPKSGLQNKSRRYYVSAGLGLAPGQVYVSRFDLNVEYGSIERQRIPTVRLAAPVAAYGIAEGIAVLNVRGADYLELFASSTMEAQHRIKLVDQHGFVLKGQNPDDEWAFMFGRSDLSMVARYPDSWQKIVRDGAGQFEDVHGIWTFQTIYPFEGGWAPNKDKDIVPSGYNWKVLSLIPHETLTGYRWQSVQAAVYVSTLLILVLAIGSYFMARSHVALIMHGLNLENTVAQRTTELRLLNHDLENARAKAEHANEAKSRFLANMSHELRTPLNAITGFSEILAGEMLGPMGNDTYKGYAEDIGRSAKHLTNLIQDLIDVSQIETDSLALREEEVDVGNLIQDCIKTVIGNASAKSVTVRSDIEVDIPTLFVDETRIKQVLLNLLTNAIKFTPSGGDIVISAKTGNERKIVIAVRDTGEGIPDVVKERIFEPFNRSINPNLQSQEGVGLGLSIARSLIELHGGSITVVTALGEGSTFLVTFPAGRSVA